MGKSGYFDLKKITCPQPIAPESPLNTSPFLLQYIFSSCFHFSSLSVPVVSVVFSGLCPPLNLPLRVIKESEFRTSEEPTTAMTSVTVSRRKKGQIPSTILNSHQHFPLENVHSAAVCDPN